MSNFENPKNIRGMGSLLLDETELKDSSIEIEEIENSIISGKDHKSKEANIDYLEMYNKNIERISKNTDTVRFNMSAGDENADNDDDLDIDTLMNKTSNYKHTNSKHASSSNYKSNDIILDKTQVV